MVLGDKPLGFYVEYCACMEEGEASHLTWATRGAGTDRSFAPATPCDLTAFAGVG